MVSRGWGVAYFCDGGLCVYSRDGKFRFFSGIGYYRFLVVWDICFKVSCVKFSVVFKIEFLKV